MPENPIRSRINLDWLACFAWLVDRANPQVTEPLGHLPSYEPQAIVLLAFTINLHLICLVQASKERKRWCHGKMK